MKHRVDSEQVRHITQHIHDLPTLPTTVARLIDIIDRPDTSAQDLSRIISSDQVLAAQILKLANSAYYGFPRKINTITLAIVVLGFETIKNLVLSVSVIDRFSRYQHAIPFDVYLFWEHAIATGLASRMLARDFGYQVVGEAFVAGLLHDIGKYVMSLYFRDQFERVFSRMIDEDIPMFQLEAELLDGAHHGVIGGWLAERWNLPERIVEGIALHHTPADAEEEHKLPWVIHFADYLVKRLGVGYSGDMSTPTFDGQIQSVFEMREKEDGTLDEPFYLNRLRNELDAEHSLFSMARRHQEYSQYPNLPAGLRRSGYAVTQS